MADPAGKGVKKVSVIVVLGAVLGAGAFSAQPARADEQLLLGVSASSESVGGVPVSEDDLLKFIPATPGVFLNGLGAWSLFFDGSAVVAPSASTQDGDLNTGFNAIGFFGGDLIFAVQGNETIGSLSVTDNDLVKFHPTTPGVFTPSDGIFSLFLDGSEFATSGSSGDQADQDINHDIDALAFLDGDLVLSVTAGETIRGVAIGDDDLIRFHPTAAGDFLNGVGTWTLFVDGSEFASGTGQANQDINGDIDAVEVLSDGSLLLSVTSGDTIRGITVADEDLLKFTPSVAGSYLNGTGTWSLFLDGNAIGDGSAGQIINSDLENVAFLPHEDQAPRPGDTGVIPEPASVLLFGLGGLGAFGVRGARRDL